MGFKLNGSLWAS